MQLQFKSDIDSATEFVRNLAKAGTVEMSERKGTFKNASVSARFQYVHYNGILFVTVTRHPVLAYEHVMNKYFSKFFPK